MTAPTVRPIIAVSEIGSILAAYEETHPVEDYWAFGWQVWPLLRMVFAHDAQTSMQGEPWSLSRDRASNRPLWRRLWGIFKHHATAWVEYLNWTLQGMARRDRCPAQDCDVIVVGSGSRYQQVGGIWVHYATEPFTELMEQAGLKCVVWQWGDPPRPSGRRVVNIIPPVRLRQRWVSLFGRTPPAPAWFDEFARFYREKLGTELKWSELSGHLRGVADSARILEPWLAQARPGLVVLDCWTNDALIAAALAAHRLGIRVMDVQHGIQEHTHVAHHWWRRAPAGGWQAMPDTFWVWGKRAAALYDQTNTVDLKVICGGNPWLSQWADGKNPAVVKTREQYRAQTSGFGRTVLVCLQNPMALDHDVLKEIVRRSPADWLWLIRPHPQWPIDEAAVEAEFGSVTQATVRVQDRSIPLYAGLSMVDLHVTASSTCANEALAFGTPTVLLGVLARQLFGEPIERGLMFYASDPTQFYILAQQAMELPRETLKEAGDSFFVSNPEERQRAVDRVVEIVCDAQDKRTERTAT